MPLSVKFKGKSYALPYKATSTIKDLKQVLITRSKLGSTTTPNSFSLYFNGDELYDEDTLESLGIQDKDKLFDNESESNGAGADNENGDGHQPSVSTKQQNQSQPKIQINLKPFNKGYKIIQFSPKATVNELRAHITTIELLENKGLFCQLFTDRMPIFHDETTGALTLEQLGIESNTNIYAFFIQQQLVGDMYQMATSIRDGFRFSDYWKPQVEGFAEQPSEQSISTLICTLHSLRHSFNTLYSNSHFFQVLRKVLDFPPAVLALYHILGGTGMNFEKTVVVSSLLCYFRQVLPLSFADKDLFHEAPVVWTSLFQLIDPASTDTDCYASINIFGADNKLLVDACYVPNSDRLKLGNKQTLMSSYPTTPLEPAHDVACLIRTLSAINRSHLKTYGIWDSTTDLSKKHQISRWSKTDYDSVRDILTKKDIYKGFCFAAGEKVEVHVLAVESSGTTVYVQEKGKSCGVETSYVTVAPCINNSLLKQSYFITGEEFDRLKRPVSSSDRRNRLIEQIDVIMLDVSGSMTHVPRSGSTSRMEDAKTYFLSLTDKIDQMDLPHSVGLYCFGEKLRETSPISTNLDKLSKKLGNAEANDGCTRLYSAIGTVVEKMIAFEESNRHWLQKDYKKRIFCLTDGDDTTNEKPHKIAQYLQTNNIVLDSVTIGGALNSNLKCVSAASGGWCFKVDSVKAGLALFESEPVLSVKERKSMMSEPIKVTDHESLLKHKDETKYPYIVKPERKTPDLSRKAVSKGVLGETTTTTTPKASTSTSPLPTMSRTKRILQEFKLCSQHEFRQFQVFIDETNFTFWKVIYIGEIGTPYAGGHWLLYIQFPDDYPTSPPTIRFETKVYHCNINNDGKICHEIIGKNWSPVISMVSVLDNISDLMKEPNFEDALDSFKGALLKSDKEKYEQEAIEWKNTHASLGIVALKNKYRLE